MSTATPFFGTHVNEINYYWADSWCSRMEKQAQACVPDGHLLIDSLWTPLDPSGMPTIDFGLLMSVVACASTPGYHGVRSTGRFQPIIEQSALTLVGLDSQGYAPLNPATGYYEFGINAAVGCAQFALHFRNTQRVAGGPLNTGLSYLEIQRPLYRGATTAHPFGSWINQDIVNRVLAKGFKQVRYLDVLGTNNYGRNDPVQVYADRMPMSRICWPIGTATFADSTTAPTTFYGQPHEMIAALSNATNTCPYLTISNLCDDTYRRQMIAGFDRGWLADGSVCPIGGTPVYPGLNPGLFMTLELGNEWWNSSFPEAFSRITTAAQTAPANSPVRYDGLTYSESTDPVLRHRIQAEWTKEMRDSAEAVLGVDSPRFRIALMGFTDDPSVIGDGLQFLDNYYGNRTGPYNTTPRRANGIVDIAGAGGYTYPNVTPQGADTGLPDNPANVTALIAAGIQSIPLPAIVATAKMFGVRFTGCYESGFIYDDPPSAIVLDATADPRTQANQQAAYDHIYGCGIDFANQYTCARPSYGFFTTLDDLTTGKALATFAVAAAVPTTNVIPNFAASTPHGMGGGPRTATQLITYVYATVPDPVGYFRAVFHGTQDSSVGPAVEVRVDGVQVATITLAPSCDCPSTVAYFTAPAGRRVVSFHVLPGHTATFSYGPQGALDYAAVPFTVPTWLPLALTPPLASLAAGTELDAAGAGWRDVAGNGSFRADGAGGFAADPALQGAGYRENINLFFGTPPPTGDYAVTLTATADPAETQQLRVMVVARATPGIDFGYRCGFDMDAVSIVDAASGTLTFTTPLTFAGTHTIRAECVGTAVTVYYDGFAVLAISSTLHSAGAPGVDIGQAIPTGSAGVRVLSYAVEVPGPAVPAPITGPSPPPPPPSPPPPTGTLAGYLYLLLMAGPR